MEPDAQLIDFWLDRTREELEFLAPKEQTPGGWKICIFRNKTLADEPQLEPAGYGDVPDEFDKSAADEAARYHTQILADRKELAGLAGSILAVPGFDLNIFQPSPVLRPVRAVVSFASELPAPQVGDNEPLQFIVEKYANLLVEALWKPR